MRTKGASRGVIFAVVLGAAGACSGDDDGGRAAAEAADPGFAADPSPEELEALLGLEVLRSVGDHDGPDPFTVTVDIAPDDEDRAARACRGLLAALPRAPAVEIVARNNQLMVVAGTPSECNQP